jgi:hypothetical protein
LWAVAGLQGEEKDKFLEALANYFQTAGAQDGTLQLTQATATMGSATTTEGRSTAAAPVAAALATAADQHKIVRWRRSTRRRSPADSPRRCRSSSAGWGDDPCRGLHPAIAPVTVQPRVSIPVTSPSRSAPGSEPSLPTWTPIASVTALEEGLLRAHEELRVAGSRFEDAKDVARLADLNEPSRLANTYIGAAPATAPMRTRSLPPPRMSLRRVPRSSV